MLSQGLLARFLARLTPRAAEIALRPETVAVALGLALVLGLAIGRAPILGRSRPLAAALRAEGSTSATGGRSPRLRDALVVLQVAASFVLLIGAGLAGLLSYTLGQRHREFGIRLALGATRRDIARLVLGRTETLVGLGSALGVAGALLVTGSLDSMLFGLATNDPATYALVVSVLTSVAVLAALPTLRRALATAPGLALRAA